MKQLWEATFEVSGKCSWNFMAASEAEARAEAIRRFRAHPKWSALYTELPPVTLKQVPRPNASTEHGDVGRSED